MYILSKWVYPFKLLFIRLHHFLVLYDWCLTIIACIPQYININQVQYLSKTHSMYMELVQFSCKLIIINNSIILYYNGINWVSKPLSIQPMTPHSVVTINQTNFIFTWFVLYCINYESHASCYVRMLSLLFRVNSWLQIQKCI